MLSRAAGENHGKHGEGKCAGAEKERQSGLFLFQGQKKNPQKRKLLPVTWVTYSFLSLFLLTRFRIVIKYTVATVILQEVDKLKAIRTVTNLAKIRMSNLQIRKLALRSLNYFLFLFLSIWSRWSILRKRTTTNKFFNIIFSEFFHTIFRISVWRTWRSDRIDSIFY